MLATVPAGNAIRASAVLLFGRPLPSHGAQHEFTIIARDREHPVMQGLPIEWLHAKDELYHGQRGPAQDMHILATAFSAKDKGGTGTNEPLVWTIPYGKGRVFTVLLGHVSGPNAEAIRCVGFQTVVARGTEWAATGKVTLPVPADFPGDEEKLSAPDGK